MLVSTGRGILFTNMMDNHEATLMHMPSVNIQKMIHRNVNATTIFM